MNKEMQTFILINVIINVQGCLHEGEFPSESGDLDSLYIQWHVLRQQINILGLADSWDFVF